MSEATNGGGYRERDEAARRMQEGKYANELAHFLQRRKDATHRVVELSGQRVKGEEMGLAELEAETEDKRYELFLESHDATGAWKGDRLGRDLKQEARQRVWERNENGFIATPEDERSHLLLINMGELDRLNASGDHSLGDQGLRLTAERIEQEVRDVLRSLPEFKDDRRLAETYEMYRYSGNDFVLSLNNVDASHAQEIQKRLSQQPVSLESVKSDIEAVPITASRVSRKDGIELMNRVDETPEQAGLTNEKVLIGAMLEQAQTLNDIAKFESRTKRMLEKADQDPKGAADFYEKFLKKSLGSLFQTEGQEGLAGFDAFLRLREEKLRSTEPHAWDHFVAERAINGAFESLKSRRAVGRAIETKIAEHVAATVLGRTESIGFVTEDEHAASTPDFKAPQPTTGMETLRSLEQVATEAASKREASPRATAEAELASVNFELEKAKRDPRTGLYQRGQLFRNLSKAFLEERPVSTIAIDMAFLKYFDKEGGPQTGNLAIDKAAEILDGVAQQFRSETVQVEAYRTGGDEFALSIVGADEATMLKIAKAVRRAEETSGRVPASAGAKPSYAAEALQFNYGLRYATDPASFKTKLKNAGIPLQHEGTMGEVEELVDYMARLADKEVEIQKSVNRILLLAQRSGKAMETGDPRNLETLKAYSQKSIFGEIGTAKIAEFAARIHGAEDAKVELRKIQAEALGFVIKQIDAQNRKTEQYEHSMDRHLEDAVRIRYFEQRLAELEEEIDGLRVQVKGAQKSNEQFHQLLAAAEEEKRAVLDLRHKILPVL